MGSKKILIITYYWPPSGGVGVQRWMNFSLQLEKMGWEPMILTPENPQFEIKDPDLVERVSHLRTFKLPIWEPFQLFHQLTGNSERKNIQQGLVMEKNKKGIKDKLSVWIRGNIFIPDPRIFWLKKASDFGAELVQKEAIATIITTGPPHSMHLIGKRIQKKTGVKWLADFRDPWSKWDVLEKLNTSLLAMQIHQHLESTVLKSADMVTTVSNRLAEAFGGVNVLNNGVSTTSLKEDGTESDEFVIGYFGMLNELRNPSQFWMTLDQMCREDPHFASKLRIKIGGIVSESIMGELNKLHQLKGKVQFLGYLSHEQVQQAYKKCNLLLLLLNKSSNSQWILPVKFFEYLAARRLILCLGSRNSDLGDIMNQRDVGEIFAYSDLQSIRAFVEDAFEKNRKPSDDEIDELLGQFSHENLAHRLDALLTELNGY